MVWVTGSVPSATVSAEPVESAAPVASVRMEPSKSDPLPVGEEYEAKEGSGHILGAIAHPVWIYENPKHEARRIGYLHGGMSVPRSEKPVATTGRCRTGWYRVAPHGFICATKDETTQDAGHPILVAYGRGADRGAPMPFKFARPRGGSPVLYAKLPNGRDQAIAEGKDLAEHRAKGAPDAVLFDLNAPIPDFLTEGQLLPKPMNLPRRKTIQNIHHGYGGQKSSFALISAYLNQGRYFALTTEFDIIPLDRVRVVRPTQIHGGEVKDLPAGIVQKATTRLERDEKGAPVVAGTYDSYQTVGLTGNVKDNLAETSDGGWLSERAMWVFRKRTTWPGFLKSSDEYKWIDISVKDQTLVAYEGHRAVYIARVSTGAGRDDPESDHATPLGMYKVQNKHLSATMTGNEVEDEYELQDVPYVQYFHGGVALHTAFWHEKFGRPVSHGCVNLTPKDAAWLFEWTDPVVPREWHGAEANGEGTLIFVH